MSPVIGLFIAVIAGVLASRPRAVTAIVVPPMLGATAAQSWYLGTGRGHNSPGQTTDSVAYWVAQIVIIVAVCGVAAAVCWVRVRRSASQRVTPSGSPSAALLVGLTLAAFAAALGAMFVVDRPVHPGSGSGHIPVTGAVAFALGLLVLVALAADRLRRTRGLRATSPEISRTAG